MGNLLKKLAVPLIATSLLLAPKPVEARDEFHRSISCGSAEVGINYNF